MKLAINKVVYGGNTLIDLTADTVTEGNLLAGIKAHDKSGAVITGTCDFDVNSQDATAAVGEVLAEKTFYARGSRMTGTMPNRGKVTGTIAAKDETYTIPNGFHDGSGTVGIDATEKAKLTSGNIKSGITILGVPGSLEPSSDVTAQTKSVTPTTTAQTVLPDETYDYLAQVTVEAIPYSEMDNAAGGQTVTIAG